jgi:DNA-binding YbaB/EbfC family protein
MVSVVMTGHHAVKRVTIDPSLSDDIEMLEDLVTAATNDAVNRIKEASNQQMSGLTQGMNLPPGFKLPF